jgi:hypothetical protein
MNTLIGLKMLKILNYVHRDVSTGNILLCDGYGRLSDLESVKQPFNLTTHKVWTVLALLSLRFDTFSSQSD